eukprot:g59961.t1
MAQLAPELWLSVFTYLSGHDHVRCIPVAHWWRELADSKELWRDKVLHKFCQGTWETAAQVCADYIKWCERRQVAPRKAALLDKLGSRTEQLFGFHWPKYKVAGITSSTAVTYEGMSGWKLFYFQRKFKCNLFVHDAPKDCQSKLVVALARMRSLWPNAQAEVAQVTEAGLPDCVCFAERKERGVKRRRLGAQQPTGSSAEIKVDCSSYEWGDLCSLRASVVNWLEKQDGLTSCADWYARQHVGAGQSGLGTGQSGPELHGPLGVTVAAAAAVQQPSALTIGNSLLDLSAHTMENGPPGPTSGSERWRQFTRFLQG